MHCSTFSDLGRTDCQGQEDAEDEYMEAEQDELLVECAGDVLTNFGRAIPPEEFASFFQTVLPLIKERLVCILLKFLLLFQI